MTNPKKFTYQIQYVDNTYRIVDWTKAEFKLVGESIVEGKAAIVLEEGIYQLQGVRAIVFIPPVPEPTEEEKKRIKEDNKLTEWGFVDSETAVWLKDQGIN